MNRTIEFSEADYARMRDAAAAAGVPLDEWIVANLPLNGNGSHAGAAAAQPSAGETPAKTMADVLAGRIGVISGGGERVASNEPPGTMADLFAGHVGVFASEGDGQLSRNTGERFADYLEEKRRAGRL
jgi:hypothetical protein